LDNAAELLEAAEAASGAGEASSDWTIVVSREGGIRMLAGSDWSLESLQSFHGAQMVYRVRRGSDVIRVEGRAGSRTCLFEAGKPNGAARLLPADFPRYELLPPAAGPRGAETRRLLAAAWD
jgi:hypothetical protein